MPGRRLAAIASLLVWALFAFLTLNVLFTDGPDLLVLLSLLVLAILGIGIFGALGD